MNKHKPSGRLSVCFSSERRLCLVIFRNAGYTGTDTYLGQRSLKGENCHDYKAHCRQIMECPLTSVYLSIQGSVRSVLVRSALLECDDDDDKDSISQNTWMRFNREELQ